MSLMLVPSAIPTRNPKKKNGAAGSSRGSTSTSDQGSPEHNSSSSIENVSLFGSGSGPEHDSLVDDEDEMSTSLPSTPTPAARTRASKGKGKKNM